MAPARDSHRFSNGTAGFALPSVLFVVGGLLVLALGILIVTGLERSTARSFSDLRKAELAARAAVEEVEAIFASETETDDFLVIQSTLENPVSTPANGTARTKAPFLFLSRRTPDSPAKAGDRVEFRHTPLFSSSSGGEGANTITGLSAPKVESFLAGSAGGSREFETLPYQDHVRVDWKSVTDSNIRTVARYAYWIEDLQGRLDAKTAGNTKNAGKHKRYGWLAADSSSTARFPAPGLNAEDSDPDPDGRDREPPLDQIALHLLDPDSGSEDTSSFDNNLIDHRELLVSPKSAMAAAGIRPPLARGGDGRLVDPIARAAEENLATGLIPYDEQALVPPAFGIDPDAIGSPKLNLNSLLSKSRDSAVTEMADWIRECLPAFESRKGGFPDDYLKTLAANALDYADDDSDATTSKSGIMGPNAYRGLDAYPLLSEVILHIKYNGTSTVRGRKRLNWEMILFVELWNHTNQEIDNKARVSYENGMRPPAIGAGVMGDRFDDPALMNDPTQVSPTLQRIGGRYWSEPFQVTLQPNQYQFYRAATITYTMDVGASSTTLQNTFEIYEDLGSSGISLMWNDIEVDRSDKLVRGNSEAVELTYITNFKKQSGKANIPGHSYGIYNTNNNYKNNMGDSRQALYLRSAAYPVSDNSYPGNVSPNRRNIRNVTIYKNTQGQTAVYGRVMPSEWPDGGHDTPVSGLSTTSQQVDNYDPADPAKFPPVMNAREGEAPTFISNRGLFFSATELGRVFDPVMYTPTYPNSNDTSRLLTGQMPAGQVSWPSVEVNSPADIHYGGGNTLRIGRPEHPRFARPSKHQPADMPGDHAARLLDLFHAGKSRSADASEREGALVRIEGHVNINTATHDALRAMAGGPLTMDPVLRKRTSDLHSSATMAPPVTPLTVSTPTISKEADVIADAVIRGRPYASPAELASVLDSAGRLVFGNRDLLPDGNKVQWSDAAAEEAFARMFESSTVRSRNFRVWVIGQAVAPAANASAATEVLAEVRKSFDIFVDPGERDADGSIDPTRIRVKITHENDF